MVWLLKKYASSTPALVSNSPLVVYFFTSVFCTVNYTFILCGVIKEYVGPSHRIERN